MYKFTLYRISISLIYILSIFFFNDTATTEIYTLSLHDALPIYLLTLWVCKLLMLICILTKNVITSCSVTMMLSRSRSEERFSRNAETDLVCRLLLEKKKTRSEK